MEPKTLRRYNLGILFNFQASWLGGITYILNLISLLDNLDDSEKPDITLFYKADLKAHVDQINYPYLESVEWIFPGALNGYFGSLISGRNLFIKDILDQYSLDAIFPLRDYPVKTRSKAKLVSWYADLQHKYYPEFFSRKINIERTLRIKFMLRNCSDLVLSSQSVADDFVKFFRIKKSISIHIFHFVSLLEDFKDLNILELRKKYNLPAKYFMVSNQFHKHKNHKVLIKALARLKEKNNEIFIAMTGSFPQAANAPHIIELNSLIEQLNLKSKICFLKVIPRHEQLFLMRHAQAIIQPSLFEGWSTVIEDAKSMQVPVIASKIKVNIEQLGSTGIYFDPQDDLALANILNSFPERNLEDVFYTAYDERVKKAAAHFMKIFKN